MVVKLTPTFKFTPKLQAGLLFLGCILLITRITVKPYAQSSHESKPIPLQTSWRSMSPRRAPQVLDIIEQDYADRIDWTFLTPVSEPPNVKSFLRYNSSKRIPMPHLSTDPRYTSRPREASSLGGRIAFINGHHGTSDDFAYVTHQLGIQFSEFNPRAFWFYGVDERRAEDVNRHGNLGDFFCRSFDTVVVGDTIPDSRFLLQHLDRIINKTTTESNETDNTTRLCQIRRIIMMTTNRFDFGFKPLELPSYHALVRRVTIKSHELGARSRGIPKIIWTANNPFDIKYAEVALGSDIGQFTLIRSVGYSTLPVVKPFPKEVTELPAVYNHYDESRFIAWLMRNDINVSVFSRNYGGPTSLSQFRCFIDFPYQASTMKMYENLLFGVVTLVPSKRLFLSRELGGYIIEGHRVSNWQDYVEYWYEDMHDYVYVFDSITELKEILARPVIDVRNIRERGEGVWKAWNAKSIAEWRRILSM
ncbi:hypothetical protein BCR33DRAFT_762505 [Rhizoclosmatium globosum]|uniref:Uncharacterized protein n=1 Tax=Rhizoclosmatium globosum TaxID=329046 RepID=A0A1Y2CV45_9FUNG|nr:hypothetical protein BCR33DRAFT_762505 [Rhizoclosmatium globosum]|eukprot:ORY50939.1 hypothetical protein BCR33DRAFT_762505 [Rhizoclosmatium globosum]